MTDTKEISKVAEATMIGDLMRIVVDQLKAQPRVWQELSESDQETYLESVRAQIETASRQAINIIAAQGMTTIVGTVDSVTFKDGIKAVVKVPSTCVGRHDLADSEGDAILLVVSNADHLINDNDLPQADPDQPVMDLD